MKIRELLQEMVDQNASDIFIVAGLPLTYQVEGRQVRWDAPLMPADTRSYMPSMVLRGAISIRSSIRSTMMMIILSRCLA